MQPLDDRYDVCGLTTPANETKKEQPSLDVLNRLDRDV